MYTYHSFFIHLAIDKHLGYLHAFAIINNTRVIMVFTVNLMFLFSLDKHQEVELLDHMVALYFIL